jgi:hypothetical protein
MAVDDSSAPTNGGQPGMEKSTDENAPAKTDKKMKKKAKKTKKTKKSRKTTEEKTDQTTQDEAAPSTKY